LKEHKEEVKKLLAERRSNIKKELWDGAVERLKQLEHNNYSYKQCWIKWKNMLSKYRVRF